MGIQIQNIRWEPCQVIEPEKQLPSGNSVKQNMDNKTIKTNKTTVAPKKYYYSYKTQKARTDKRVSLNVAPLQFDRSGNFNPSQEPFAARIAYVLGSKRKKLPKGQTIYGFLNSCLSNSCGLIFPYTPQINITHNVNYDSTEITHSNLQLQHYRNTPPPSYSLEATFTADNRENALHMLSAIWFLRAVTKCDFGEEANERGYAGMPPPVLYLNGYNQIMDNIPVIVKSFSYSLPKDKDYVSLGINLDKSSFIYNDRTLYSDVNGSFYDNEDYSSSSDGMKYINGLANAIKSLQSDATTMASNRYNSCYFNNWLPTEMSFSINLEVQPNILKNKKYFDLDYYKMGVYNLDAYKGGARVYIPTSDGKEDCTELLSFDSYEAVGTKVDETLFNDKVKYTLETGKSDAFSGISPNQTSITQKQTQTFINNDIKIEPTYEEDTTMYDWVKKTLDKESTQKVLSSIGLGGLSSASKTYKFDRSGFTW